MKRVNTFPKKPKASANSVKACAGATLVATLGNYNYGDYQACTASPLDAQSAGEAWAPNKHAHVSQSSFLAVFCVKKYNCWLFREEDWAGCVQDGDLHTNWKRFQKIRKLHWEDFL
jgi:hypothetical protein